MNGLFVLLLVILLNFGQTTLGEEATPENKIVCIAAQGQWVCAPSDEQAQAKAMRLLEADNTQSVTIQVEDSQSPNPEPINPLPESATV